MSDYWIAFGDIHDDIARLDAVSELAGARGVIITGDITLGGGIRQAERVLAPIAARVPRVYAQIGNMDRGEVTGWLEEKGWNLHGRGRELFPGVFAAGVGTSSFTPFGTPSEFPESRLEEWMEAALSEARGLAVKEAASVDGDILRDVPGIRPQARLRGRPRLVLVSHMPPHASVCDRLRNGEPAGSPAVRRFIEEHQPELCLCGHIHESRGTEHIGSTLVANPGTLPTGGYALVFQREVNGVPRVVAELKSLI